MADNIPISNPGDTIPISNPSDTIPISNPGDVIPISNPQGPGVNAPSQPNVNPTPSWNAPWTFDNWNRDFLKTPQSGSDPFTQDQISTGLAQGTSYSDFTGAAIAAGHDTPPPRPDLGSIYSDTPPEQSTFQAPSWTDILGQEFKDRAAIETTPKGMEVTPDQAGSILPGGMIEGVGMDIAGTIAAKVARLSQLANENTMGGAMESGNFFRGVLERMNANGHLGVRSLVQPGTEGMRVPLLNNTDINALRSALGTTAKWLGAGTAFSYTMQYGLGTGRAAQ